MPGPRYTRLVQSLPSTVPFVGPEALERGRGQPFIARLGANENVFGPSPAAVAAMRRAVDEVWMYGDPESHDLRMALADHHRIAPEAIVVGEGIDALLGYLVRLLIAPSDPVVTSAGAYPTFAFHVAGFGGVLHAVPYRGDHEDPDALVARVRETGARLVYLANPDNPMGSWHEAGVVERMLGVLPEDTVLILDEAYVEFAPDGTAPALDPSRPGLIRMRTFSKAYGMAGARIGYAIAHPALAANFDKIRNHFALGRIAQAGALAALGDGAHLAHVREQVAAARLRIGAIARENGLTPLPSATNFVAVDAGADGPFARRLVQELAARGIFVRMPLIAPHDRCIRVSCGRDADLAALAAALPGALMAARR